MTMPNKQVPCPICGAYAEENLFNNFTSASYDCNSCGRYVIGPEYINDIDKDIFASYLLYNCNLFSVHDKYTFHFIGYEETFSFFNKEYPNSSIVKIGEVENWYPKIFSERVDYILLALGKLSVYTGKSVPLIGSYGNSLLFIKQYIDKHELSKENIDEQNTFIREYLAEQKLAKCEYSQLTLLPKGMERIYELQKNMSNNKQAFVAMSFSDDMKNVQKAIEEGIRRAGYIPHAMNKIEHNNQIVPEILYQIKQSKFVVAEFSTKNNGAYYEAGYAAGLGKEVIHICQKDKFGKKGHFDIKQKSTVLWKTEDEIAELLFKHIEATIGKGN
jgi:nucleoside 2-deoxyribosyltransferase